MSKMTVKIDVHDNYKYMSATLDAKHFHELEQYINELAMTDMMKKIKSEKGTKDK